DLPNTFKINTRRPVDGLSHELLFNELELQGFFHKILGNGKLFRRILDQFFFRMSTVPLLVLVFQSEMKSRTDPLHGVRSNALLQGKAIYKIEVELVLLNSPVRILFEK